MYRCGVLMCGVYISLYHIGRLTKQDIWSTLMDKYFSQGSSRDVAQASSVYLNNDMSQETGLNLTLYTPHLKSNKIRAYIPMQTVTVRIRNIFGRGISQPIQEIHYLLRAS